MQLLSRPRAGSWLDGRGVDRESDANWARIDANDTFVDAHMATFALIRAQFAWIRGCAFRDDPTARRGSISPVHSRLCLSRRSNGPARIHFPGGSSQPSSQPRTTRTL